MNAYRTVDDIQQAGCRYGYVPFYFLAVLAIAWFFPIKVAGVSTSTMD